jgi:hypothetical protein
MKQPLARVLLSILYIGIDHNSRSVLELNDRVAQESIIHQWGCLACESFLQKCHKMVKSCNPNLPNTNTIFPRLLANCAIFI